MVLFGLTTLDGACSLFGPPIRSSYLLHLSCRYTAKHLSMIDLVLSTLKGIFIGRSRSASLPLPRAITKSFIVKQHMQRNLSNSLGTRTRLSQHMHLRIVFPSSSSDPPCFFFPLVTLPGGGRGASSGWSSTGTSASSMSPSPSPTMPKFPVLLFRPNNFGNGCETVRLCDALAGESLERDGEPGSGFGARGSGLLVLVLAVDADELLARDALLLEDPARMRDDHVGGMAAAARHRNAALLCGAAIRDNQQQSSARRRSKATGRLMFPARRRSCSKVQRCRPRSDAIGPSTFSRLTS